MGEKLNTYLDSLAFKHLSRRRKKLLEKYPQVVCYSFDHIGTYINCFGRYELHELNGLSKIFPALKDTDALDIGANIGNHTLFFSEFFNRVHSFEPNPRTFELLKLNTESRSNVSIYKIGASNRDGVVKAKISKANIGGATIEIGAGDVNGQGISIQFEVKQLDQMNELKAVKRIGFVKIDVEGHELPALEGMRDLLYEHKPYIAFEQDGKALQANSIFRWLTDVGYSYFYEIKVIRTRIPTSVPKVLRIPLRMLEIITRNFPAIHIERLEKVQPKFYHMIIASPNEVKFES